MSNHGIGSFFVSVSKNPIFGGFFVILSKEPPSLKYKGLLIIYVRTSTLKSELTLFT